MFPIIFFSIATMTFDNKFGQVPGTNESTYKTSLAFSIIYVVLYTLIIMAIQFVPYYTNFAKLEFLN
jgi:hypothetical protein